MCTLTARPAPVTPLPVLRLASFMESTGEMMIQIYLEHTADRLGLSTAQIIMVVVYILIFLGLLISFILLAISAWQNKSSFNAVIQSALISGAGRGVTALRQRGKAESEGNLDGLVKKLTDGNKDDADGE